MAKPFMTLNWGNLDRVTQRYRSFIVSGVPEAERSIRLEVAKLFAQEIRRSIRMKGLTWQRNLLNSVKAKMSKGRVTISVSAVNPFTGVDYAAWHEFSPRGHNVLYLGGLDKPMLSQWAQDKGISPPALFFVKPTPFAKPAVQRASRSLRNVSQSELSDVVRKRLKT